MATTLSCTSILVNINNPTYYFQQIVFKFKFYFACITSKYFLKAHNNKSNNNNNNLLFL